MTKKIPYSKNFHIILFTSLFLLLLVALRLSWMNFVDVPQQAVAKQGRIDLGEVDTSENFKIKLKGEFEFFPSTFLIGEGSKKMIEKGEKVYSDVPEAWDQYFKDTEDVHYGTYRFRIVKKHSSPQLYGIKIPDSLSPYELYVNGQMIGWLGDLTTDNKQSAPISRPMTYYFSLDSAESEVIIQGVHMNRFTDGGMKKSIIFGDLQSMEQESSFSLITQIAVCVVFIFYLFYTILLYGIGIREKSLIFFLILIVSVLVTVIVSSNRLLFTVVPLNWILANKLFFFSYIMTMLFFILFLQEIVKDYLKSKVLNTLVIISIAYLVFVMTVPIEFVFRTIIIYTTMFIMSPILLASFIRLIIIKEKKGSMFLLLAVTAIANNSFFNLLYQKIDLPISHYPFDLLIAVTAVSGFWFTQYLQTTIQAKVLTIKLQKEIDHKDDFLANTSHELRNPLHGVINIAQTMLEKEGEKLEKENQINLQLLLSISHHMSFMLDDLLDLVRLKEKTIHLHKRPLNIHSIVSGVCDMFRFMLQGKPIDLIVSLPKDLPLVLADENRLIQIFSNFIHNAIKFTSEGAITINGKVNKGFVEISIKDTGIGIDPLLQQKIFEPYEQVDTSMTSIGGGLGLGLSICREMVSLHGGEVAISSTVGKGSTFTFTLPIANETTLVENSGQNEHLEGIDLLQQYTPFIHTNALLEHEAAITSEMNTGIITGKPSVLIVDDDAVNLQVLINVLSKETYHIHTALNGQEALEKLATYRFDLVISDIMLPNMSGYELAKRIRDQFSIAELPILFLTARHQSKDISHGFLVGANDYVTKPMEYMELKARVNALIHMKRSSEAKLRMEGAWLQAQIQPHFFFNTLAAIISLHRVDDDKMEELLYAFSDYLQTSFAFQNADLVVPIDYELKIVRSYVAIEQIRFANKISIKWDIPENIELFVPPLSIQTLVENAIQHGILKRIEGGTVRIQISELANQFTISIIDDGVGFDYTAQDKHKSVGLLNTTQRLKQLFGVELNITSVRNEGTTVSFAIPKHFNKKIKHMLSSLE